MAKKSPLKQPTATSRTRAEVPVFHVYEMTDPQGHLTEEQKKWPVVTELLPCESVATTQPADAQPKTPPAAQ